MLDLKRYSVFVRRDDDNWAIVWVTARTKRGARRAALARVPRNGRGTFGQQGYKASDARVTG